MQNHVQNTLRKLQMHNRVELTRYAIEQGLDADDLRTAGPSLLEIADELYGLALADFTPARDARAKQLKAEDAALAAQVKALRKPALGGVGGQPARAPRDRAGRPGPRRRRGPARAQAELAGEELRALTRQRRQLTAAVTTRARAVAAERGPEGHRGGVRPGRGHADRRDARRGLRPGGAQRAARRAARDDRRGRRRPRAGPRAARGAGLRRRGTTGAGRPARPDLRVVPDPEADRKAVEAAERLLADTAEKHAEAERALAAAVADVEELEARSLQVQAEIDELRRRLVELEESSEEVDDELGDAEDVRAEAQDALAAAAREREAADAALERLRQA